MTALDTIPQNRNFLSPLNFKFQIKKAPSVNFFLQSVGIPGFQLSPTYQPNPFINIPVSGDHIDVEPLTISFKVDENLVNYMELYTWITELGFPNNCGEYNKLASQPVTSGLGITSDISLLILSSSRNPIYDVTFFDCFPISLGRLLFDTIAPDVNFIDTTASFKYRYFNIAKI